MPPQDSTLRAWWPTTQSLDVVYGDLPSIAAALESEFLRFAGVAGLETSWRRFGGLGTAFESASFFTNVTTHVVALPTHSNWVVLWNNNFLCDGYDSLCWNLTTRYGFITLHWRASDETTTFQPGTSFTHRSMNGAHLVERAVASIQEDRRWIFHQVGPPLPEEDSAKYTLRRRRDRLNEKSMMDMLARLGANPWSESFYDLERRDAFVLSRQVPVKAIQRTPEQVVTGVA